MVKIFFITFFIAELVIALAVILNIFKFNKAVNNWNNWLLANKDTLCSGLVGFRLIFTHFTKDLNKFKQLVARKRQEYLINILKTSLIYFGIFTLKGKYKKAILAYQVTKEIYEGLFESND